jgi:hypothetical protein
LPNDVGSRHRKNNAAIAPMASAMPAQSTATFVVRRR